MDTFIRFLFEFMSVFFGGLGKIFQGLVSGIGQMFDFTQYSYVVSRYHNDLNMGEWILVVIAIIILIVLLGLIVLLVFFALRKFLRFRKSNVSQESLLEEIGNLQKEVVKLSDEKDKLLAMKVTQIGLSPTESAEVPIASAGSAVVEGDAEVLGDAEELDGE